MDQITPADEDGANTSPFPRDQPPRDPESSAHDELKRDPGADNYGTGRKRPSESEDDEPLAPRSRPGSRSAGHARTFVGSAREEVRRRAERGVSRGIDRIAERLEEAAERLENIAEDRLQNLGGGYKAAEVAQTTAGWIDDAASYLRDRDLGELQRDLEAQVREKPFQSILLALGAGWILGKIMR